MSLRRLLSVVMLAVLAGAAVVPFAGRDDPAPVAPPTPVSTADPDRRAALVALREWDQQRSAAWRRGRPTALASLYAAGSVSGAADRVLLASYADRGLRVAGIRMQRAAVRVLASDEARMVLEVVDRLVGAVAVGRDGTRIGLPRDNWSQRRIVLRAGPRGWRVVEVRDQPRPAVSTDVTSRSANS